MKKLILLLPLFLSISVFAQRPLPVDCPGLHDNLLVMQKSFGDLSQGKKERISGGDLISNWTTDYNLCTVDGILQLISGNTAVNFTFTKKFKFTDATLKQIVQKLHDGIKEVFGSTFAEKFEEQGGNQSLFDEQDGDGGLDDFKKYKWVNKTTAGKVVQVKSVTLSYSYVDSKLSVNFEYFELK